MTAPEITQTFLKSVLHYDQETGVFTWRKRDDVRPQWNGRYAGKQAGYEWSPDGGKTWYIVIRILDWPFYAHRLAQLYVTGKWPKRGIDHEDLDGTNNRWRNLRAATKAQNGHNRGKTARSSSGLKGAFKCKNGRWRSQIRANGSLHWLGSFDTAEDAHAAYATAAQKLHGRFARSI